MDVPAVKLTEVPGLVVPLPFPPVGKKLMALLEFTVILPAAEIVKVNWEVEVVVAVIALEMVTFPACVPPVLEVITLTFPDRPFVFMLPEIVALLPKRQSTIS